MVKCKSCDAMIYPQADPSELEPICRRMGCCTDTCYIEKLERDVSDLKSELIFKDDVLASYMKGADRISRQLEEFKKKS